MEKADARRIVNDAIRPLRYALCLSDWDIHISYEKLRENVAGQCEPIPAYREANIRIDAEEVKNEAKLLDVLRHELLHCVLSERALVLDCADPHLGVGPARKSFVEVYRHSWEIEVGNIERVFDFAGMTTRRLIALGRRRLDMALGKKKRKGKN